MRRVAVPLIEYLDARGVTEQISVGGLPVAKFGTEPN
ncbi:SelB domain-containing protein [Micromonospora deserti]